MTNTDRLSVALLTNAPAPYRTPFFNELAMRCRLLVIFDTLRNPGREWEVDTREFRFRWTVTRALPFTGRLVGHGRIQRWIPNIPLNAVSAINRFGPDVVVSSELGARTASAAVFCYLGRRPLIVWWEGTPHSERSVSKRKIRLRQTLLRRATRAWANGEESQKSLTAYGVPESQIDLDIIGTNTARWRKEVEDARCSRRAVIRERFGLRGVVILFVGGLTERKGIREVMSALSLLAQDHLPEWSVLFVGSGELSEEIEAWARLHPALPVALTGFVQPAQLPGYFAAGDLFVMPSLEDVWGMVCLEALVAGLPQVTSVFAGAANALVTSTEIGSVVNPQDIQSLAEHLAHRIRLGIARVPGEMREEMVIKWSPAAMTDRAMSSIRSSVASSGVSCE
jgi:glycosyltransferase involved in cell wall biosynthesis